MKRISSDAIWTGGTENRTEENQAAGIRTIRDGRFAEGHYQIGEICEGKKATSSERCSATA